MSDLVAYHLEEVGSGESLAARDTREAAQDALDTAESYSGPGTVVLAASTVTGEALFIAV